jgi:hypothetical protein
MKFSQPDVMWLCEGCELRNRYFPLKIKFLAKRTMNLPENSQYKRLLAVVLIFGFINEKLKMKKVMMNIINWIMKIGNRLCGSISKLIIVTGRNVMLSILHKTSRP